jgi:hypothetical protein
MVSCIFSSSIFNHHLRIRILLKCFIRIHNTEGNVILSCLSGISFLYVILSCLSGISFLYSYLFNCVGCQGEGLRQQGEEEQQRG